MWLPKCGIRRCEANSYRAVPFLKRRARFLVSTEFDYNNKRRPYQVTFMRNLKSEFVTRVRLPAFFLKRLVINILGNAGQRFRRVYLTSARIFAESELRWLNRRGVGETRFHELMPLYPTLQRVLYIHIPKCGGTSIRRSLVQEHKCAPVPVPNSGSINQAINYMVWSASRLSLQRRFLNRLAQERESEDLRQRFLRVFAGYCIAQSPKRVFILGHQRASEMLPYFRDGRDLLFATVRAPAEILKSLVAYRVTHTLEDQLRPDSMQLLESLQLDIKAFTELVNLQPKQLTELILEQQPPYLTKFLTFDERTDHESVWKGIKDHSVFLAHVSDQEYMIAKLLGNKPGLHLENTSANRQGMAAEYTAAVQKSWIEPFVDRESVMLYRKIEALGIIGFWQRGGTVREYRDLLKQS